MEEQKAAVEERPGVGAGLIGMLNAFVDPVGAAKRVPAKLFWLWPVILLGIIYVVFGYLMVPYAMQFADVQLNQVATQQGLPPDRMEAATRVAHIAVQASFYFTPILVVGLLLLFAWLVVVTGSMVGARAKFRDVFSLMTACSLIPALQYIAGYIVISTKGDEIRTQEQLTPPFGLDIAFQRVHGPLLALLNYFSIFQIWYLVVLTLGLAYLAKCSKGKAFAALTPAWLLPLLLRMLQAALQGGTTA